MDTATDTERASRSLLLSCAEADGTHSANTLAREVNRGRLVRLRRGVYFPAQEWFSAYPSERFELATAATAAQRDAPVFCRGTALSVHRIPLLNTPSAVQIRGRDRHQARKAPQPSMTGKLTSAAFLRAAQQQGELSGTDLNALALRGFGTHCVSPTDIPQGIPPQEVELLGQRAFVEPLTLAVADTVPHLPFADAVVILDAALRTDVTRSDLVSTVELCTRTKAQRFAWQKALDFADPRSESVGESLSRVRIAELGFEVPELQHTIHVDAATYRLDCWWEKAGIVGEFDGWQKYQSGGSAALREEKVREDAIRSTVGAVVRWYWEDLQNPQRLLKKLLRAGVPRVSP
ncbi:hypothetical protein [Nesterenkonia ebinurensis]|uniref:hypothetical protein n=1 Tax=Nesterenkonia ebinurensis TaxID=2608252 RepID=UPI00168B0E75|nr:hypothetical protein [Nesterenkonia ebinurensis]